MFETRAVCFRLPRRRALRSRGRTLRAAALAFPATSAPRGLCTHVLLLLLLLLLRLLPLLLGQRQCCRRWLRESPAGPHAARAAPTSACTNGPALSSSSFVQFNRFVVTFATTNDDLPRQARDEYTDTYRDAAERNRWCPAPIFLAAGDRIIACCAPLAQPCLQLRHSPAQNASPF
eukprot:COSAG06_NODE_1748_length_8478_cov_16.692923_7_plen_176_part_00